MVNACSVTQAARAIIGLFGALLLTLAQVYPYEIKSTATTLDDLRSGGNRLHLGKVLDSYCSGHAVDALAWSTSLSYQDITKTIQDSASRVLSYKTGRYTEQSFSANMIPSLPDSATQKKETPSHTVRVVLLVTAVVATAAFLLWIISHTQVANPR